MKDYINLADFKNDILDVCDAYDLTELFESSIDDFIEDLKRGIEARRNK